MTLSSEPNYGDANSSPSPEMQARMIEAEREQLRERISALESDLALIQQGKDAAERALRYERERARELAQNGTLSLKRDWVGLVNELKILKGETVGENAEENKAWQETLVIDFVNKLRMGALADLAEKDDETLYVMAKAYEIWYRACCHVLQGRSLQIKISRNSEFEQAKVEDKQKRVAKEAEKLEKRRRTPEEKMMESLMTLGMSENDAKAHIKALNSAAKTIMGEDKIQ